MKLARILIFAAAIALLYPAGATAQTPSERTVVPNLAMGTIDGKYWELADNRGGVVLLNFWATWCEPCRTETPMLVKIGGEYGKQGLKVFGIALDEGRTELIRKFVEEYKIDYPILIPPSESPFYKLESVPTTLLIDRSGKLAKKYTGAVPEAELIRDIELLIKETPPQN